MKKRNLWTGLLLGMILVVGVYVYVRGKLHIDEGAIITSLKPPSEDITKKLPQGSDLDTPLTIPTGFRLAVFADLRKIGAPRVLTFDTDGNLVASIPSAGKVIVLPDKNKDGIADQVIDLIHDLDRPHGITFTEGTVYVAETDRVVRYAYHKENMTIGSSQELFKLPSGGRHFTRTIKIHEDKLYTSVGSSCDTCSESDWQRAAILVSNLDGSDLKVYAKGLRNTVFFTFDNAGRMWGNDMGRDFLGDNLPPDEVNIIENGKDYGWPKCFGKNIHDSKFDKTLYRLAPGANICEGLLMISSTFDYPAHVAPLGIVFIDSPIFSKEDQGDILAAFHGSWNSSIAVGYKVVKLDVEGSRVVKMEDFITGWLKGRDVLGRPVDLIFDKDGVLYISDDKANLVYILTK